jgi:ferredoxin
MWKGRFFCRWICPLGTVYSIPSQFSRKRRFFKWNGRGTIFWFIIFASFAGLPLILFLDPLSTFTRLGVMGKGTAHAMVWIPGVLIPLMLLLSFIQPGLWCVHLCPLGYFLELMQLKRKPQPTHNRGRRELLTGLFLGAPLALLFRNAARAVETDLPFLPPGVKDLESFAATCIRCYACIGTCPSGVLTVRKKGGVAEFCIPEMDFDRKRGTYCEQYCNACSQICPSGAIQAISMDEKQLRKVGTASIIRESCIAWHEGKECLACDEFCGYNAMEAPLGCDGIPKPFVNQQKCRGCGACRNVCPAIREGNAISIETQLRQTVITVEEDASTLPHSMDRDYCCEVSNIINSDTD